MVTMDLSTVLLNEAAGVLECTQLYMSRIGGAVILGFIIGSRRQLLVALQFSTDTKI